MLRAGPFSDERIVRLANRRFIPFYFDLANSGFASDAKARKFVVKKRKRLGGSAVPTPPVLFMSASGEVLGEVSNFASTKKVLAEMRRVLQKHPEFNEPTDAEKELTGIARSEFLFDLHDDAGAAKALKKLDSPRAHYLRGRLARFSSDFEAMDESFAKVGNAKAHADDVRMEQAYRHWTAADFEMLDAHLTGFPTKSDRYTEARYFLGLARYHSGEKKAALAIWAETIKGCSQDPWIYRADWAYTGAKRNRKRGFFSSGGKRSSRLNRIGYMGRRNPDLTAR